jgi:glutaryl-CoA dehydrogenase
MRMGGPDLLSDGLAVTSQEPMLSRSPAWSTWKSLAAKTALHRNCRAGQSCRSVNRLPWFSKQKDRWLWPLARGEVSGAVVLTEPGNGSDSVSLETTMVHDGGEFVLNVEKKWIGNGAVGGVTVT